MTPDFVHFNDYFVMAGDQTDHTVGQPQSGLWWGSIDDLWSFGKPQGWGAVWYKDNVKRGQASDPFLMTGFDKKSVSLLSKPCHRARVDIEVDVLGDGSWRKITSLDSGKSGFATYQFASGFAAHWARAVAKSDADEVSVSFAYL